MITALIVFHEGTDSSSVYYELSEAGFEALRSAVLYDGNFNTYKNIFIQKYKDSYSELFESIKEDKHEVFNTENKAELETEIATITPSIHTGVVYDKNDIIIAITAISGVKKISYEVCNNSSKDITCIVSSVAVNGYMVQDSSAFVEISSESKAMGSYDITAAQKDISCFEICSLDIYFDACYSDSYQPLNIPVIHLGQDTQEASSDIRVTKGLQMQIVQ